MDMGSRPGLTCKVQQKGAQLLIIVVLISTTSTLGDLLGVIILE